jgi:hypothetical protein
MIAPGQSDEAAVLKVNFGVLAGLIDSIHLEASLAQNNKSVSKRPAHQPLPPFSLHVVGWASGQVELPAMPAIRF